MIHVALRIQFNRDLLVFNRVWHLKIIFTGVIIRTYNLYSVWILSHIERINLISMDELFSDDSMIIIGPDYPQ